MVSSFNPQNMIDPVATARGSDATYLRNLRIVSDQPVAESSGDSFGLRMNLQLLIDILQMKIDRRGCDAQFCSSGFIIVAFDQQLQDSYFMWREVVLSAFGRTDFAE